MKEGKNRKRQMWKGALFGACLLAWGLSAKAFVPESVSLKGEGNKVEVLMSPVEKETVSLQLSMEVQVTKGASAASVSFEFDPGLSGSVKQYRYQKETGILTLYLSGDGSKSLPEEDFVLGSVVLDSKSGEPAEATVRVKTDSLKVVNRGYDLQTRGEIYAPSEGKAVAGSEQPEPDTEPDPEDPEPTDPKPEDPSEKAPSEDRVQGSDKKTGTHTSSGDSSGEAASSAESSVIPGQKSRPGVGIRIGAGQTTAGAANSSDSMPSEAEPVQEETENEQEADADKQETEWQKELRDKYTEETVDDLTFWGIIGALCAGALVILLMLLEYRRREEKKRRRKKKKSKKNNKKMK